MHDASAAIMIDFPKVDMLVNIIEHLNYINTYKI